MITLNGQICYSPLPPQDYAWWFEGRPRGPASLAVDRATGCAHLIAQGIDPRQVGAGLHQWNLAWLLRQEWDKLPELIKDGEPCPKSEHDTGWFVDVFEFANTYSEHLARPPLRFLSIIENMKILLPGGSRPNDLKGRVSPSEEGKVIQVQFGKRQ